MPSQLRAGIVGAGFMGRVHAAAVRAAGGTVTRVSANTPEGARRGAAELRALSAADSPEDLMQAEDVDVVHVCTPNHLHARQAEYALRAGKHVICEKPLATTVHDAQRLAALAAATDAVTAVPFVYRFYPTVREARARIAAGEAGQLWLLHGSYLQDWLTRAQDTDWRVDPALGGASRAFGDVGVHWCDLMEFVTGHRIVRLVATTAMAFEERLSTTAAGATASPVGTEDGAGVLFGTNRGAAGSLVVSQVSPGRKNHLWFSFDGTDASFSFDQEIPDTLWIGGRTENRVVVRGPDTLSASATPYVTLPAGHPQGYQEAFNAFVRDAYAAIDANRPEGLPTFADGSRAAAVTAAVVESARSGTWVEVPA
jgi:predicted dehydrogenase